MVFSSTNYSASSCVSARTASWSFLPAVSCCLGRRLTQADSAAQETLEQAFEKSLTTSGALLGGQDPTFLTVSPCSSGTLVPGVANESLGELSVLATVMQLVAVQLENDNKLKALHDVTNPPAGRILLATASYANTQTHRRSLSQSWSLQL